MNICEVSYMKRRNLGNYEHDEVKLVGQIEEGEDTMEAIAKLKWHCEQALLMRVEPVKETVKEEIKDEKPVKKKVTKTTKTRTNKSVAKSDESPKDEIVEDTIEEVPEAPKVVELAEVKQSLAAVWKAKGKPVAVDILKSFKVSRSEDLDESQFEAVLAECEKCLK